MIKFIGLEAKTMILVYLNIFVIISVSININAEIIKTEKVCNFPEAICPANRCCSDLSCKEEEASFKCCEIPKGYTRHTFSDYIISKEGWGCSNCPKCGNVYLSILVLDTIISDYYILTHLNNISIDFFGNIYD